jgi:outer membrane protein OmpA-like peptidoglycan-associated protein
MKKHKTVQTQNIKAKREARRRQKPEGNPRDNARAQAESSVELVGALDNPIDARNILWSVGPMQSAQRKALAIQVGQCQGNMQLAHILCHKTTLGNPSTNLDYAHENVSYPSVLEIQRQDGTDPERQARNAFIGRSLMPDANGKDLQSVTGIGGFNARYDASRQELLIRLRVGINFIDGLTYNHTANQVTPASNDFNTDAIDLINRHFPDPSVVTPAQFNALQADIAGNWQWTTQKTKWIQDYAKAANDAWGSKYYFKSRRWDDVYSSVRVDLDVHEGHRSNDHCKATVYKVPDTRVGGRAEVSSTSGSPTGYTGTFTSRALAGQLNVLNFTALYPRGSAKVSRATINGQPAATQLDRMITTFQRGTPTGGVPIVITGHASSTGNRSINQTISNRRAHNIGQYLRSQGQRIANYRISTKGVGAEGAGSGQQWRRADIQVGEGGRQQTMLHETGHMFGLGDEYVVQGFIRGGTGGVTGQPVAHSALSTAMGGGVQGAVYENNENIMSLGNAIHPQHYSTFLEALNQVATPEQFQYGGVGNAPALLPDLIPPRGLPVREHESVVA